MSERVCTDGALVKVKQCKKCTQIKGARTTLRQEKRLVITPLAKPHRSKSKATMEYK